MVMMFIGGVVLMLEGFLVLWEIYGAGVFCSRPNPYSGKAIKTVDFVKSYPDGGVILPI